MPSTSGPVSPSTSLVPNQILDALREAAPPSKAKARAQGKHETMQKPPAVNPVELMWAHQLKREHTYLLARIDGLSSTVSSLEHQQAAQASDFCTIQNLEQARESMVKEHKIDMADLLNTFATTGESNRLALAKSSADLSASFEDSLQPLQSRTLSVEQKYETIEEQIAQVKASLHKHDCYVTAMIQRFSNELRLVTDKLLSKGSPYQGPCLGHDRLVPQVGTDKNDNSHDLLAENSPSANTLGFVQSGLKRIVVTEAKKDILDGRDSGVFLDQSPNHSASLNNRQSRFRHERSFSQATTIDEDVTAQAQAMQESGNDRPSIMMLPSTTCFVRSLPVKDAFKPSVSRQERQKALIHAHAKDKSLRRVVEQEPTPPSPQKPRKQRPVMRQDTDIIPDSGCGSTGIKTQAGPVDDSRVAGRKHALLEIKGPGTQRAEGAYEDESQVRHEPASPTIEMCRIETNVFRHERCAFGAGLRNAYKRKPVSPDERMERAETIAEGPNKRRRRTIPRTVQELAAEFARERELGCNRFAAKWGGSMSGVKV